LSLTLLAGEQLWQNVVWRAKVRILLEQFKDPESNLVDYLYSQRKQA